MLPPTSVSDPFPAASPGGLARVVGLGGAVWMGLGSILGTGVFVSLGIATGVAGSSVLLAVALAALVATANGLSSAQLAAAQPVSGGTYAYGHTYLGPSAGFAAGWLFLAAKSASAATAALGCAGYLLHTLNVPGGSVVRVAAALALVGALTALVAGGLRRSHVVNIGIVSLTLISLVAFVAFGFASADASTIAARIGPAAWGDAWRTPSTLLHATALLFVAYTGYGRIATLGEEVREPSRTIPRAIVATLVVSMVLYVAVAATAVAVVGPEAFADATGQAAAPLEVVSRSFGTPGVAWLVAAGAVSAMAGVLLNLVLGLSRVLLAMARRRELPEALGYVDAESSSPKRAVWTMGAVIAALVLVGDLRLTWSFSAFTVLVYYGITNWAALRLPEEARRFPLWIARAGLVSCFGLAFFVEPSVWFAGLALLGAGFLVRRTVMGRTAHGSAGDGSSDA